MKQSPEPEEETQFQTVMVISVEMPVVFRYKTWKLLWAKASAVMVHLC